MTFLPLRIRYNSFRKDIFSAFPTKQLTRCRLNWTMKQLHLKMNREEHNQNCDLESKMIFMQQMKNRLRKTKIWAFNKEKYWLNWLNKFLDSKENKPWSTTVSDWPLLANFRCMSRAEFREIHPDPLSNAHEIRVDVFSRNRSEFTLKIIKSAIGRVFQLFIF